MKKVDMYSKKRMYGSPTNATHMRPVQI